jgi:hypothetical protein
MIIWTMNNQVRRTFTRKFYKNTALKVRRTS